MTAVAWFLLTMTAFAVTGLKDLPTAVVPAQISEGSSTQCSPNSSNQSSEIPGLLDFVGWGFFLAMQLFPAKSSDLFRSGLFVHFPRKSTTYKIKVCERSTVKDCMFSEPMRLPGRFQGMWWMDGIGDTTSVISTGGVPYDTRSRTALVSPYAKQQWGYDAINSTWKGFFWSASGPALFKFVLTFHLDYHLVFNEDISFAQIVPSVILLGTRIFLPTSLFDFPMEWMGQESWERTTRLLGVFPTKLGDYYLRRIINGDGSKGYWFDKGWLTDRGGAPVAVGVQTFSD
eukprot:jgi/Botrbrau1/1461/Bobra.178_3s0019.1